MPHKATGKGLASSSPTSVFWIRKTLDEGCGLEPRRWPHAPRPRPHSPPRRFADNVPAEMSRRTDRDRCAEKELAGRQSYDLRSGRFQGRSTRSVGFERLSNLESTKG